MKQAIKSYNTVTRLAGHLLPFFLAAVAIPVVVVMGFGLFAIYRFGYVLVFMLILSLSAVIIIVPAWYLKKRVKTKKEEISGHEEQDSLVQPSMEWGDAGSRAWLSANAQIDRLIEKDPRWQAMQNHAIEVVRLVADACNKRGLNSELAFSAPEMLRLVEEVSRRYRRTLLENVPFVEKVNISTLKIVYDHREKAKIAGKAWDAYRAYRIFTPTGLIAEARSQLMNRFFSGLRQDLEFQMKRAFLQEVAGVAIDLYSGRFRVDDDEIKKSKAVETDKKRLAPAPDPIRICFVGQISSGKSSVVNALLGKMDAEVSILPSTDAVTVHQCTIKGADMVHLVDLPGIDGSKNVNATHIREITQSDIVLWVVKADQSAKQPDVLLRQEIDAFYAQEKNQFRKKPVIMGILNQVDLLKPRNEWQPPYDINSPISPKAKIISEALEYNKKVLHMDKWIPLSVAPDRKHFNISELRSLLSMEFDTAIQIQLNRRRMESHANLNLKEQYNRLARAGKALFGLYVHNK